MRLGGRWLVDGALVNPVPVSAARALGARLVIAVNLNADMLGRGMTIAEPRLRRQRRRCREELAKQRRGLRAMFGAGALAASASSSAAPTGPAFRP